MFTCLSFGTFQWCRLWFHNCFIFTESIAQKFLWPNASHPSFANIINHCAESLICIRIFFLRFRVKKLTFENVVEEVEGIIFAQRSIGLLKSPFDMLKRMFWNVEKSLPTALVRQVKFKSFYRQQRIADDFFQSHRLQKWVEVKIVIFAPNFEWLSGCSWVRRKLYVMYETSNERYWRDELKDVTVKGRRCWFWVYLQTYSIGCFGTIVGINEWIQAVYVKNVGQLKMTASIMVQGSLSTGLQHIENSLLQQSLRDLEVEWDGVCEECRALIDAGTVQIDKIVLNWFE